MEVNMKWLWRDADAPSIELGVERGLDRVGRGQLAMAWTKHAFDHEKFRPIMTRKWEVVPAAGGAHGYYMYCWSTVDKYYHLLAAYPTGSIDYRLVKAMEKDLWMNMNRPIGDRYSEMQMKEHAATARRMRTQKEDQRHWMAENRSRFHDSIFEGKHHRRDARISSYAGQGNRGSAAPDTVTKSLREDGWTPKPKIGG